MTAAPETLPRTEAGLRAEAQDLQAQLRRAAEHRHPRPDLVERLRRVQALQRAQATADLDEPLALRFCPGCGAVDTCPDTCPAQDPDSPEGLF